MNRKTNLMKPELTPSEFYSKYVRINGKKPRPLTEEEKSFMDNAHKLEYESVFIGLKRRRPIIFNFKHMEECLNHMPMDEMILKDTEPQEDIGKKMKRLLNNQPCKFYKSK